MASLCTEDRMTLREAVERLQPDHQPEGALSSLKEHSTQEWDLNTTFERATKLAEFGWEEKAGELDNYMSTITRLTDGGWSTEWDVAGECVDIGAYLDGEPECMLNFNVPTIRCVNLLVNICARGSADAQFLFNRGVAIASAVYALQASGVSVSLQVGEWVTGSESEQTTHHTSIEINQFNQYIDPARLAFWLAHPAALRRCIFRYNEQQSEEIRERYGFYPSSGYGSPADGDQPKLNQDGIIYIPFPETSDLELYQTPEIAFQNIQALLAKQGIDLSTRD